MSRTKRGKRHRGKAVEWRDGEVQNPSKDKNSKKEFVFKGDGWATKAKGGPGNKSGWKQPIPKWLRKMYLEKEIK